MCFFEPVGIDDGVCDTTNSCDHVEQHVGVALGFVVLCFKIVVFVKMCYTERALFTGEASKFLKKRFCLQLDRAVLSTSFFPKATIKNIMVPYNFIYCKN